MIKFVNAKINIGLQIVRRREDGYHDLQTVFYPVGLYAGSAKDETPFCDILEVIPLAEPGRIEFVTTGRKVDCPPERNLVYRAAKLYMDEEAGEPFGIKIILDKHLPDGAGMGGGSADATMTLQAVAELESELTGREMPSRERMCELALKLGADCPFFVENRPCYGTGVGENLEPIPLDLTGMHILIVKPRVYVSTAEAFAGIRPEEGDIDLRQLAEIPIEEWQGLVTNDFEKTIFAIHPELKSLKEQIQGAGAVYVSMTGSGSAIYGFFRNREVAEEAYHRVGGLPTIESRYLLRL